MHAPKFLHKCMHICSELALGLSGTEYTGCEGLKISKKGGHAVRLGEDVRVISAHRGSKHSITNIPFRKK